MDYVIPGYVPKLWTDKMKFDIIATMTEARLFTVDETCQRLGISKSLFYELVKAGNILIYKLGSKTLIPSYSIEDFVQMAYDCGVTGDEAFNGNDS